MSAAVVAMNRPANSRPDGRPKWLEAIALDDRLGPMVLKLAVLLANRFTDGNTGDCFPSRETLMKTMRCCERTVRRCLRALEDAGYLEVDHVAGYEAGRKTPLLRLQMPAPQKAKTVPAGMNAAVQPRRNWGDKIASRAERARTTKSKNPDCVVRPHNKDESTDLTHLRERQAEPLWITSRAAQSGAPEAQRSDRGKAGSGLERGGAVVPLHPAGRGAASGVERLADGPEVRRGTGALRKAPVGQIMAKLGRARAGDDGACLVPSRPGATGLPPEGSEVGPCADQGGEAPRSCRPEPSERRPKKSFAEICREVGYAPNLSDAPRSHGPGIWP